MAKVRVKNNHLHFNGANYFRGKSENIVLGSYGEKRRPIFGVNRLEVEEHIDPNLFDIREPATATIDFSTTRKGDFTEGLDGTFKGVDFDISIRQMWDRFQSGNLVLVKFAVDLGPLKRAVNRDRRAIAFLKRLAKSRARIVSEVWVVTSAQLAEKLNRAQSIKASGKRGKIHIQVAGTASQDVTTNLTLSKGTTFAYLLARIDKWDKKLRKRRKRIIDLDEDQFGPG